MKTQSIPKDAVQYTWTTRDHLVAQMWPKHLVEGAKNEDRYVTPYRILPSSLADCKKWNAGDSVKFPLTKTNELWCVKPYFIDGFEWVEVPAAVTGYKTIGDLCAKLHAFNPNRFVAKYYDFSKKSDKAKAEVAQLLFEYWKNSTYRHAAIQAGFDFGNPHYLSKATDQGGQKLRWVLAKKPEPVKAPVAPGSQILQAQDPFLDALAADVTEMRMKAARITELLKTSERIMRDRLTLAQRFTALSTLVEVCANAHSEANPEAVAMSGTARSLEKKALASLRNKPIAELLSESNLPSNLRDALRMSFGHSDDIAAEIKRLGLALVEKLTADADFAARCGTWGKLALKKGLAGTPAFRARYDKLTVALVEVLAALQEVHTSTGFEDKLLEILEHVPDAPITDDNAIEKIGKRSALDVVLALGGPAISLMTTSVGNTPGPPSLYIAVVQLRAAKKIADAIAAAGHGSTAACAKLLDELMGQLRRALPNNKALADKLEDAIRRNNQNALLDMKSQVLDEVGGNYQATRGWKLGIVALQVIAMAMSVVAMHRKDTIEFADVLGVVGSGATMIVPIIDVTFTKFAERAAGSLSKVSKGLGAFSAFIGVILATMQLGEADKNKDSVALFVAGTSLLGNFCLMIGSVAWYGVTIPGLNVAGLVLIATSTTVSLVVVALDENVPKTTKLAKAILASIKSHPMIDLLRDEPEFRSLMAKLDQQIDEVFLPTPQYNMFVVDRLRAVGFKQSEIGAVVEQTGAPILPG